MDTRRLIIFIILSIGLLLIWERFSPKPLTQTTTNVTATTNNNNSRTNTVNDNDFNLNSNKVITVTTDVIQAQINTLGGDIRELDLLQHGQQEDRKRAYSLLTDKNNRVYIAQTGLVANDGIKLPTHNTIFTATEYNYTLTPNQKELKWHRCY
jgi:YidC/Oxa1 family membrane protein insertase